ncbi:hypothetical protein JB92DRAFT_3101058 [Gautieria morchelliformis]|nr:hypothetical protein JB92DRAFT_3101058 [Gautieria morchelliformis]
MARPNERWWAKSELILDAGANQAAAGLLLNPDALQKLERPRPEADVSVTVWELPEDARAPYTHQLRKQKPRSFARSARLLRSSNPGLCFYSRIPAARGAALPLSHLDSVNLRMITCGGVTGELYAKKASGDRGMGHPKQLAHGSHSVDCLQDNTQCSTCIFLGTTCIATETTQHSASRTQIKPVWAGTSWEDGEVAKNQERHRFLHDGAAQTCVGSIRWSTNDFDAAQGPGTGRHPVDAIITKFVVIGKVAALAAKAGGDNGQLDHRRLLSDLEQETPAQRGPLGTVGAAQALRLRSTLPTPFPCLKLALERTSFHDPPKSFRNEHMAVAEIADEKVIWGHRRLIVTKSSDGLKPSPMPMPIVEHWFPSYSSRLVQSCRSFGRGCSWRNRDTVPVLTLMQRLMIVKQRSNDG